MADLKEWFWGCPLESVIDPEDEVEEKVSGPSASVTITFGDQAENHVGMQKIGVAAEKGLGLKHLTNAMTRFQKLGGQAFIVRLNDFLPNQDAKNPPPGSPAVSKAYILVLRNAAQIFRTGSSQCRSAPRDDQPSPEYQEQMSLEWDKKARMYGRVVDKHARHNLCFGDFDQEPDYENGKGRVVNFSHVPLLRSLQLSLEKLLGSRGKNLAAEGNHYFDLKKCGIGFHGDAERKVVIAVKLGADSCLEFQWYHRNAEIGGRLRIEFSDGDVYAMSEKATGCDWRSSSFPTLRHAAGCAKFTG